MKLIALNWRKRSVSARAWMQGCLLVMLTLLTLWAQAQNLQPIPALTAHVIDTTGTLGAGRESIEDKLGAFERAKGSQIVVLMVPTTQPEDIASYANRVANTWKIGRKGVGDGLLLIVAKDDRKLRIEVAKTLEGAIPDLAAKQIIDDAISPRFRAGDYAGWPERGGRSNHRLGQWRKAARSRPAWQHWQWHGHAGF